MKTSRLCFLSVPMSVAVSIALAGCNRDDAPVNISYRQVGICKVYDTAAGPVAPRVDEGLAVFKIESLDNSKAGKSFTFEPERLYVDQSTPSQKAGQVWEWNRRFASTDKRFVQSTGISPAAMATIPGGGKVEASSFVVIPVGINNPSGGPEAKQFALDLVYDAGSADKGENHVSEGVNFIKANATDAWQVVENCKEVALK